MHETENKLIARRRNAFSMLELVIVMTLIGIVAAIAVPRYAGTTARFKASGAANRIVADLRMAQRRARLTGASQTVVFDAVNRTYTLQGVPDPDQPALTYTVNLADDPYNATMNTVTFGGDTLIVFDGYGVPDSGGSLNIQVGDLQWSITVDSQTGEANTAEVGIIEVPPL